MKAKILLGMMLILLACTHQLGWTENNQTNANATGNLEVCSILTKEDLASIVGEPIAEAKKGEFPPGHPKIKVTQCTYKAVKGVKSLDVLIKESSVDMDSAEATKKLMIDTGSKIEDVSGVGDTAFWSGSQLHVFRGKNLSILVSVLGFQNPKDNSVKVAKFILSKIKE